MNNLFNDSGAEFSECRTFRKYLWRIWDDKKPLLMFIGLNPSTANEVKSDNTITRIMGFTKSWGYGGFYMTNLFEKVDKNPNGLKGYTEFKTENENLLFIRAKCEKVIFCWGGFKVAKERAKQVIELFPDGMCLGKNDDGSPKHPLFLSGKTKLEKY